MTELLAPAGSMAALHAAIANGANAVYLGGKSFSARAFADNFTLDEIAQAVRLAHFHGLKVYVAVNTLVADREMVALLFYAAELYKCGVDAVIVQDIGLIQLLGEALPDLPLHASTQMTVHEAQALDLLARHGVSRAILARELPLTAIKELTAHSPIELEGFVHGALCVCYSGQCLFSSLAGGRSGNRGRCAQPCRLAYQLTDSFGDELETRAAGKYLLSPRELFGYSEAEALHQAGLAAWKIEGRMKKPQYVAIVCRIYSRLLKLLDEKRLIYPEDEELRQLMQAFNRDRTIGYWQGNPGASLISYTRPNNRGLFLGRILEAKNGHIRLRLQQPLHRGDGLEIWVSGQREGFTVSGILLDGEQAERAEPGDTVSLPAPAGLPGDRVFKTYDAPLMEGAELSYQNLPQKPLEFEVFACRGRALRISARDADGYQAEAASDYVVTAAKKAGPSLPLLQSQLGRLGGSGYTLGKVRGEIEDSILLPSSVLNQLRRELVDSLFAQRRAKDAARPFDEAHFTSVVKNAEPRPKARARGPKAAYPRLSVLVHQLETAQMAARLGVRDIYFDALGFAGEERVSLPRAAGEIKGRARIIPYLPYIIHPGQQMEWRRQIAEWKQAGLESAVVNNLGQIGLLKSMGWQGAIYAGQGLNVFNSAACRFLAGEGIKRIMLSPEMDLEQIRQLDAAGLESEVFAQGALQLMVSEYCLIGAVCGLRNKDENEDTPCLHPCRRYHDYHLSDEKGYRFPLKPDNDCRLHVFNSREHCLLAEIPALSEAGVDRLLLDLRLYTPRRAEALLALYQEAAGDGFGFGEALRKLPNLVQDYTRGHLYRGV